MIPGAKEWNNNLFVMFSHLFLFSNWYLSQFFPPNVEGTVGEKSFFDPKASYFWEFGSAWLKGRTVIW